MIIEKTDSGEMLLRIDQSLYHHESILKASYKFTNNCYIRIDSIDLEHYGIYFTPKLPEMDMVLQLNEFCNELIDQELRFTLEESNRPIKELIIKKAFSPFSNE